MRRFDYSSSPNGLLDDQILSLIASIYEHKGRQDLYIQAKADSLEALCTIAKIQSTESSNSIEGIRTDASRLKALITSSVSPRDRDEQEIAGYRDVLSLIHESYDAIPVSPSVILQLHKMMYRYSGYSYGGHWKDTDNVIAEIDANGHAHTRFTPLPAISTPRAVQQLCAAYNEAITNHSVDPLVLMSMFVFDFVSIHPFNDGNGRMSRLLTLLLLYKSGFIVGKYISLEQVIERSKETYYEALQLSSSGWLSGTNDYKPFVSYMLGCIRLAYTLFEERVEGIVTPTESKSHRIERAIKRSPAPISKQEILSLCPDISEITVKRTLSSLLQSGKIEKLGSGRSTTYRWLG